MDISTVHATLLPDIKEKFKRSFIDYDAAIRDLKNNGKYNGKRLKANNAESMMVRKKNHEFF